MRAWPAREYDYLVGPGSKQGTLPLAQIAEPQLLVIAQFVLEAFADQALQLMPDPSEVRVVGVPNFCHKSSQIPGTGPVKGRRTPSSKPFGTIRVPQFSPRWWYNPCSRHMSKILEKTYTQDHQLCYTLVGNQDKV